MLFWLAIVEMSVIISLLQPLLIKVLIAYIIDGLNAWEQYGITFYKFPDDHTLSWLTPDKQYGLSIAMIIVFTQALKCVIDENCSFG